MTVRIKAIPRSPRTEFAGSMADGTLKVRVAAPAEKGKANEALCAFLAAHYGVARDRVAVISGHTAALKLVRIDGVSATNIPPAP
jgi:uncharacterized protein YggU (UPF0235/DUF167 family)